MSKTTRVPEAVLETHRLGKFTGYDLRDGKYYIASTHKDSFERIREERRALEMLFVMVTDHIAKRLEAVTSAQSRWWAGIEDDLGIIFREKGWRYNFQEGCIERIPEVPKAKE